MCPAQGAGGVLLRELAMKAEGEDTKTWPQGTHNLLQQTRPSSLGAKREQCGAGWLPAEPQGCCPAVKQPYRERAEGSRAQAS